MVAASSPSASPGVDSVLLDKAVKALLKHHKSQSKEKDALLGSDDPVHVQFTLNKIPQRTSPTPIRVDIPHPLHKLLQNNNENTDDDDDSGLEEVEVCLIVKDESKKWVQDLIQKFPNSTAFSTIKKVLTLTSLRSKYPQHKDKRELLKRYDLFLADDRILPMLGKALGKNFFKEKKQPVPLKLTRKEALPFAIEKCLKGTFMWISAGTCLSIKAGTTGMPIQNVFENMEAIINNASSRIPRKWANIAAISIKTGQSVALPVYNKTREELEEIAKMAQVDVSTKDGKRKRNEEDDVVEKEDEELEKVKVTKKKKKELAAKSPLVKALKKSKEVEKETKEIEKKAKENQKLKTSSKNETKATKTPTKTKSAKKQKVKTPAKDDKPVESKEKKEFVASKKFKGAKKGYIFKKGSNGVGYYLDVKPVVDKVVINAMIRSSSQSNKGNKRRKSGGGGGRRRR